MSAALDMPTNPISSVLITNQTTLPTLGDLQVMRAAKQDINAAWLMERNRDVKSWLPENDKSENRTNFIDVASSFAEQRSISLDFVYLMT